MTSKERQQVLEWACKQGRFLGGHDLYGPLLVTKVTEPKPMHKVHINGEGFEGVKRDALLSAMSEVGSNQRLLSKKLNVSRHTVRAWMRKFAVMCLLLPLCVCAQNFTLKWDPSPSPGVTNYILYGHTNELSWTNLSSAPLKLNAGTNTQWLVEVSRDGRYWFTATAVADGLQSSNSNVLVVDVPKAPPLLYTVVLQYGATVGSVTNEALFLKLRPIP